MDGLEPGCLQDAFGGLITQNFSCHLLEKKKNKELPGLLR